MRSFWIRCTLSCLMLAAPATLHAKHHGHHEGGKGGHHKRMGAILETLDLNADQKKQLQAFDERHRGDRKQHMDRVHAAHKSLHEAMLNPDTDEATLRSKHDALVKERVAGMELHLTHMLAIRNVLNKEQRKAFAEKLPRGHGWKKHGRKKRR